MGSLGQQKSPRIIRYKDLEPSWHLPNQVPGLMRWMINWVGGGEGFVNSNPRDSYESLESAVGLMHIPAGNRQSGLHYHSVNEIYVILKGEVMGWDGNKEVHRAGPLDCLYTPKDTPHGVRAAGDEPVDLIWIHDAIEKKGTSKYWDGSTPNPQTRPVEIVKFKDLEPRWTALDLREPGHMHYMLSYVGGKDGRLNFNRGVAVENDNVGIGLLVIEPGHKKVAERVPTSEVYVLVRGEAVVNFGAGNTELRRLDAVYIPAGASWTIRNHGAEQAFLVWVHEQVQPASAGAPYQNHSL
ncbi:uncharacterized protein A1O5_09982 [Cladophialophora psammophila CBS 110553]|uniref:Cupin type-2 domain-containing protein n=1 Tax=Cladophialophora psammophila CBS 110553 TaxID=1182543 RepID=W9WF99_9EURO|nr:uncharacterized protein A1O5_09982 [Cladophialophora psammophila CBS 110553]EXJ66787.1 hypothetical protein A1O5_09982 [Cladophialophora psammophila CBS 110553]